ncbi:hypothetical protein A2331_00635 [Candidatus Falkowbacteria bacterium RIFOXYB2_FULL_34_18]|uniref:Uncharacterized protein n=1 Tax=Candidatus Falkowbacteria bacterium RIFOXYD2_FULL_34_120 TaxID=1798007 RepID=A0A1F5TM71_9BACT|nr:MAG: hypothetical protein A2331_00635 [Candidatus Falkowbacteria bacterium RIFOXYB2_FULL_34_18]OGF29198.1 MAG: hypothetical protein A2500_05950 [Candidatus Falkowbacteria bacterium RIFOXYC12_FULL_34_55]OGF37736.1 MAG: hypothetical protein A2466_06280 [Candidatus Falkowbacteria bacterium RIFOXYC2_FULL_34_220]OGF38720.1 MAG: hypothetical protein A2515_01615 [Candidatus Falkowbacteria bacterium RIFOXYD12_FULL_34_57]OGF39954.1 MAG: hypothetical protein A2531_01870 [Candidatus Falkowbacteria bact
MEFLKNLNLKPANILKVAGLALVAIILIALAFRLIGSSLNSFSGINTKSQNMSALKISPGMSESYDMDYGGAVDAVGLSVRNITAPSTSIPPVNNGNIIGDDAEEFEVTEYNTTVETRYLDETCKKIADLKSREDVIFENASEYEKNCNYSFKVKRDSVKEILSIIESLDPKELNENTYTIKRLIEDYTSELEILQKKLNSIEETLNNAINAYDDITELATKTRDVENLAKIIDSKIRIIERLTQERININSQLERLNRSKAEQLDRLEYTYFRVYVFENKFIDREDLKDSWKTAIKSFVRDINKIAQDITINLAALLFLILEYIIYLFIVLIVVKYTWKLARNIWKK